MLPMHNRHALSSYFLSMVTSALLLVEVHAWYLKHLPLDDVAAFFMHKNYTWQVLWELIYRRKCHSPEHESVNHYVTFVFMTS